MTKKRKTVETLASRKSSSRHYGIINLLKITYVDGHISHGVHSDGMLVIFGDGEPAARKYFANCDQS